MADQAAEGLRRIARQLRKTTEDYGRDAAQEWRERSDDTRTELARLWSQIEDIVERRIRPAAREASRDMRHYVEDGREVAMDAAGRLRDATRAHPLLAIGVAVATTWVVASLLRGRR